ncbi:putative ammonium transporter 1 [Stegostoma tigrinum]|uniref:putative ammonium transporter 1 n=1 Tax=Stegostoma tigrinum TaxID=3053191 RepID=UPI00286FDF4B|nr:putative ammonium transporter 1 [Stegostoma tigrinum]
MVTIPSRIFHSEDYAGSGVVFLVGGTAALIASCVTHAHVVRCTTPTINQSYSLPALWLVHKVTLQSLEMVSWPALLWSILYYQQDLQVAVCGGANKYLPALAVMCGASASLLYMAFEHLCTVAKIDDPTDTIAIYLSGGSLGLMFAGLFIDQRNNQGQAVAMEYNCLALCVVMVWTTFVMGFVYLLLKFIGVLKPFPKIEPQAIDKYKQETNFSTEKCETSVNKMKRR